MSKRKRKVKLKTKNINNASALKVYALAKALKCEIEDLLILKTFAMSHTHISFLSKADNILTLVVSPRILKNSAKLLNKSSSFNICFLVLSTTS